MHVPHKPRGVGIAPAASEKLWDNLERLRLTLGLDQQHWADCLQITEKEYIRHSLEQTDLSALSIMNLAERLELNFESIVAGDLDFKTVAARFSGNQAQLPDQYARAAFSKRRTSINVLEYLETFHGWRTRIRVLRRFQMSESVFTDPDAEVSIQFLRDLCEYLSDQGFSDDVLFGMGAHSVVSNQNSELGRKLRTMRSSRALHEETFGHYVGKYYDKNFDYRLHRLGADHCYVDVVPSEQVVDGLDGGLVGSAHICTVKSGTFSSLNGYLGLPFSDVHEVSCIHEGAAVCRYLIEFGSTPRPAGFLGIA